MSKTFSQKRGEPPRPPQLGLQGALHRLRDRHAEVHKDLTVIEPDETFLAWSERGALHGQLRVDGRLFRLDDRPAMAWVYAQMPSTLEEAQRATLILRKCAQVGFTTMEMLFHIFWALKFPGVKAGLFLPDEQLARGKSTHRFQPVLQAVMATRPAGADTVDQSGSAVLRFVGQSRVHFLWTSGKTTTESNPMDMVSFDEVQEMLIEDMENVRERMSASDLKFTLMGSTPNWPEADIDYWYRTGSQWRFHSACPTCGVEEPLDDNFPACIGYDPDAIDRVSGEPGDYRYRCRNEHWIDDPQLGTWKPDNPEADKRRVKSIHFHQMLSRAVTPREMFEAFHHGDSRKNFFNRKLGKPFQDPSEIPVSLAHLNACAAAGAELGLTWKTSAAETVMGIDHMGGFNVVIIKEALPDGRQAVVHGEEIYGDDPFARCGELMDLYGVRACVVENLPNFNDARRFRDLFPGRVWIANYAELGDQAFVWGDTPKLTISERRTDESERDRCTVALNQYKCMQKSLFRFVNTECLFADPQGLVQEIREKGRMRLAAIAKDRIFLHLQKTALVTESVGDGERKLRVKVVKVGIDPHFAYANMLCDVAWARQGPPASIFIPDAPASGRGPSVAPQLLGLPRQVQGLLDETYENQTTSETCGNCGLFPRPAPDGQQVLQAYCEAYGANVVARERGCPQWSSAD